MSTQETTVKDIFDSTYRYLSRYKETLNRLNVFPVPDGDTGVNVLLTIKGAIDATNGIFADSPIAYIRSVTRTMLMSSRGCSGVMISLYSDGVAETLCSSDFSIDAVSRALREGYERAYRATPEPQEGTMLTVMREFHRKFEEIRGDSQDTLSLIKKCIPHVWDVLRRTPDMMPLLKECGVVDSGAAAFVITLEGLSQALEASASVARFASHVRTRMRLGRVSAEPKQREPLPIEYQFCTELIIACDGEVSEEEVRRSLDSFGDSVMVAIAGPSCKIHVHTNEPDTVIDSMSSFGNVVESKIDDMKQQHRNLLHMNADGGTVRSVLFVVDGKGFAPLLQGLGADEVLTYGIRPVSARKVATRIMRMGTRDVTVLFDRDVHVELQERLSSLPGHRVSCVCTPSAASLLQIQLTCPPGSDIAESAGQANAEPVKWFGVDRVQGDAATVIAGRVEQERGSETLVTIYRGRRARKTPLTAELKEAIPEVEFEEHYGGQHRFEYIVSME